MSKTLEQLQQEMNAKIPRAAVKEREGAGRMSFSYLSTDYVIDRMNNVFGNLNWATDTVENKCVFEGNVNDKFTAHYIARVKIEAQHIDDKGRVVRTTHTGTGYGDGTDKYNLGKAHELAAKEAESDALKRAAKNLGMSFGLALYDKEQVNVEEEKDEFKKEDNQQSAKAASESKGNQRGDEGSKKVSTTAKKAQSDDEKSKVLTIISATSKVAVQRGKATIDDLRAFMRTNYKTDIKENLTIEQAKEFLEHLNTINN